MDGADLEYELEILASGIMHGREAFFSASCYPLR
jgi:hypothetical protein